MSVPGGRLKRVFKAALLPLAWGARRRQAGLTVLVYHRIGAGQGREMDLPEPVFREQMVYLRARRMVVPLLDGLEQLSAGQAPAEDLVAVTFDDGYREVATRAWPVLRALRIPATVFVTTGFLDGVIGAPVRAGAAGVGDPPLPLGWDELGELTASGLITAESHSHTHRDFDAISEAEAEEELATAAAILERRTGRYPEAFAYPRSAVAHEAVVARHHRFGVGGDGNKNIVGAFRALRVSRTPVRATDGLFFFRARLDGAAPLEDRVYAWMRRR